MAVAIARRLREGDSVGVGVNSPIPTAGVLLASRIHAPGLRFRVDGQPGGIAFVGSKEFFDFAQRGRLDVFFLSGVQIDARGNINLHVLGEYGSPRRRFPGAFGSAVLYSVVPRVILFRTEHSPRTFVPQVDFISAAPGPAGPALVVTPLALLGFDQEARRLELVSYHPGQSVDSVRAATGFDLAVRAGAGETPVPTARELELLRGSVYEEMEGTHPGFVAAQRAGV